MGGYAQDFVAGLHYLLAGIRLITAPRIRAYVVIPLIINSLLFAGGLLYGAHLWGRLLDTTLPSWLEWLEWLLWPLFVVLALGVVFFCFSLLANLIAAPFNGNLAKAVEVRLTGQTREHNGGLRKLPAELIGAIGSELRKLIYIVLRLLPFLIGLLIPGIQIIASLAWSLFAAWLLALEYLDYPMGNHGLSFSEQRRRLAQRRMLVLGFGGGVMLLMLIPVANFMVMPVAVAGATVMWVERFKEDHA